MSIDASPTAGPLTPPTASAVAATATTTAAPRPTSRLVKNITSNWTAVVVGMTCSFLISPVTVNSLGAAHYGIWTLLMQFTGYLWLFDFGVRESVVKYVAQYHATGERDELSSTVRTAVSLYTVVALAGLAAVGGLAIALPYVFNIPPQDVRTARLSALLAGATIAQGFVFNVFVGVLMGLQQYYLMARIGIFITITRAGLTYVLLTNGFGLVSLALLQFGVSLASNLFVYRLAVSRLPYLSFGWALPQRQAAAKLLNYGKYVLVTNIGDKIVLASDSVIIGLFLPISSLAYYAIGGSLIEYFRAFIVSMAHTLTPISSGLEARNDTRALGTVFLTGCKVAMLLGLPVCIGFIMLGDRFINLWMGDAYGAAAGQVLAVLSVGHLLGLPYYLMSSVLHGLGRHAIIARFRIIEGAINLVLSVVLVQRIGIVGVALGTVIPHTLIVGIALPLFMPSVLPISLREYYISTYVRPFLASLPFWGVCWFIATVVRPGNLGSFMGSVTLGLVAYAVPGWIIGLRPSERDYVRARLRRLLMPAAAVA
jgi:O-antigen/teichoic acid export membrane protein